MKRKTKNREIIKFTRAEQRGIIVLCIMLFAIIGFRVYQTTHYRKISLTRDSFNLPNPVQKEHREKEIERTAVNSESEDEHVPHAITSFDPNTATVDKLIDVGFPDYIANRILKFRLKGGVFYNPKDLNKIYGIDTNLVASLYGKISIGEEFRKISSRNIPNERINLNLADSATLCKLHGIGPVLAGRIIKYRTLLGGFYTPSQITEVYGLDDEVFESLRELVYVDSIGLTQIDLNTVDFNHLRQHPYLKRTEAHAILSYRRVSKKIHKKSELIDNYILSTHTYQAIAPYFTTELNDFNETSLPE